MQPNVCIFLCPRPPEARKSDIAECSVIDIIWTITLKIILKARSEGNSINEAHGKEELNQNLKCIVRIFPNKIQSGRLTDKLTAALAI